MQNIRPPDIKGTPRTVVSRMTSELVLCRSGPGVTVQDLGRTGFLAQGLSRGGAADPIALAEGAALLGQSADLAAIEIAGTTVTVEVTSPVLIALTGAPMRARRDGGDLRWNASHLLLPGERLELAPSGVGHFAYLHVRGGLAVPERVGGRGAHLAAGLGSALATGARLPVARADSAPLGSVGLDPVDRFEGGPIRVLAGPQTSLFPEETLRRFFATEFVRTAWGNRQGVRLGFDTEGFRPADGLNLVSEVIVPGDLQITGDGTPFVLGPECQTIGGYPRIGTVVPQDLPSVLQATTGAPLRFVLVSLAQALADFAAPEVLARALRVQVRPLVRDPRTIPDLLSYNLVSGVTAGHELSDPEEDS